MIMKKVMAIWTIVLLIIMVFSGIVLPIIGEESIDSNQPTSRGNPRWSSYKAYYNETFTIQKGWEWENVSIAVFVQTTDTTTRSKDSQGSSGTFTSAAVMQSAIDFLDSTKTSTGTSRNVLGELFTATWCQFCPGGVGAFDRITRDSSFFPTKTTMIELHASGDHGNAAGVTRSNLYGFGGIPTAIFDGLECFTGGNLNANSSTPESHYKRIINARAAKNSVIDISTFGEKDENGGWINASVELLSPTPLRNLQVQFYVLEDLYPANNTGAYYRHTVQNILTPRAFTPPNHPPKVKSTLSDFNILEDDSDSTTIQLGAAFEDEDLDVLTFSSNKDGNDKENIKVEIDTEGNVTFTPDNNWNGAEDITFYAEDAGMTPAEQTITVTILSENDPPEIANPMPDFTMYEDIPIENKFNLSSVFSDVDMDPELNADPQEPLDFSYSGDNHIAVSISNGWVSFDPDPDWNGNETITFGATDTESESIYDNVKIWVRSDNDPPVLNNPLPDASLDEDSELEEFVDLNAYYSDTDGDSLTYEIIEPDNIEVKLKYKSGSVFVSIHPEQNYWGTDTITVQARDIPGSDPINGTIKVTVNSVNDAPRLNFTDEWNIVSSEILIDEDEITVYEDSEVELYVTAYDPADNDALTFSDDTELFDIDPTTGKVLFTPTNDDVGEYDVIFAVDDGQTIDNIDSETFKFIVENVNDPPEGVKIVKPEDGKTYTADSPIDFLGTADDPDLDIDGSKEYLSYEWFTDVGTGSLSFDSEFTTNLEPGDYVITLLVTDSEGAKVTTEVSITVDIDKTTDTDSDGTPDYEDDDDDGDGLPDAWENKYPNYMNPLDASDANKDPDGDGYSNLKEYLGMDGVPGGDDSTNPTRKSSVPEKQVDDKGSDGGDDDEGLDYTMIAILGVIIVVLLLVLLFFFMRKRKKGEADETSPQPTEGQVPPPEMMQTQMPMQQQQMDMPMPLPTEMQQQQQPGQPESMQESGMGYEQPTPTSEPAQQPYIDQTQDYQQPMYQIPEQQTTPTQTEQQLPPEQPQLEQPQQEPEQQEQPLHEGEQPAPEKQE
jgi:hypothetical protein